jgi:adenylate cyclase
MAMDRLSGKLAVILHADVAGSTRLVQQDEQLAHERIQDAFRCFSQVVDKYRGQVLEFRGDALLAEFDRPSDAVTAALAFQADHGLRLEQFTDGLKPCIRVGIAMGEVVVADGTITGAGVVLAQRVEQLAEPGGLCITAAIHEALPNRMPFNQQDLGEQVLKGFDESVRVYRVGLQPGATIPPPQPGSDPGSRRSNWSLATALVMVLLIAVALVFWIKPWESADHQLSAGSAPPLLNKPSIAVLPFDNMSEDPEQIYFSDGIAEDIITDLSQLNNLAVIARNSSFTYRGKSTKVQDIGVDLGVKYLLEGSVRKVGEQIRITVQLIDTGNGHHLWAERYDRQLTDVFAVQDEITQQIVSALSVQLSGDEQQQLAHNATNSFEAYDLFLQGQRFRNSSKEDLAQKAAIYEKVIDLDPGYARAYGALAVVLSRQVSSGYSDSPVEGMERALKVAQKGASIYPHSPHVQWALGYIYLYRKEFDKAVDALERAILLSPNYADGYALLALIKNNLGQAEDAIGLLEKAMKLNPHYSWDYLYNLGRAHYTLGHYQRAAKYISQALERNETSGYSRLFLVASYVQLGRQDDAEWEVMQLETSHPEITLGLLQQTMPIGDVDLLQRLLSDLRMAGLPE